MKTITLAALALGLSLAGSAQSAPATPGEVLGHCQGLAGGHYGIKIIQDTIDVRVEATHNYIHGRAACEYVTGSELQCAGLWQVIRSAHERGQIVPLQVDLRYDRAAHGGAGLWRATFRPYYDDRAVTIDCDVSEEKLPAYDD